LLALLAELQAPELGDLERELLQLHVASVNLLAVVLDASQQLGTDLTKNRSFQGGEFVGRDGWVCKH